MPRGIGPGRLVQNALAVAKVVVLLGFVAAGLSFGEGNAANFGVGGSAAPGGLLLALIPVMFSYSGWNAAAYVAEEIRNPGRNVPLALGLGTAAVIVVYIALNVLYVYAMPAPELAGLKVRVIDAPADRLFGSQVGDVLALMDLLNTIVHPDDRDACHNHIVDFRTSSHEEMEFRIVARDGQVKWLSHFCGPIYVNGEFLGRRSSNRDITERKKLEDTLLQARKMESLGQFAGGIAHDFNNVLTAIGGFAHLLSDLPEKKEQDSAECIEQISLAVKFGKNLTSHLLTFGPKQIIHPSTWNRVRS